MQVKGTIVRGHQVASGAGGDPRFPGGTLAMQLPHFAERGLDLNDYFPATVNVQLAGNFTIVNPDHTFREVKWHRTEPAEDFSFVSCRLRLQPADGWTEGLVYFPHPETKPEHFQPPGLIEVILEKRIDALTYGQAVILEVPEGKISFDPSRPKSRDQGR